jgi:hypothetical protein
VLLAGLTTALLFRHTPSAAPPPVPQSTDPLLLHKMSGPPIPALPSERPAARIESQATSLPGERQRPPAILLPLDPGQPPPELPKVYPGEAAPAPPPASQPSDPRRSHKIVDGDTLGALAERYLGSAERSGEIFEANRDLLTSPELLPIGTVLRIPPRGVEVSGNPMRASPPR